MEGVEEVAVDVKDHGEWVQDLKVSVLLPINYRLSNPRATLQYFLEQKCYRYHITIWDAVKVREKTDESIQKEESDTKRRTT